MRAVDFLSYSEMASTCVTLRPTLANVDRLLSGVSAQALNAPNHCASMTSAFRHFSLLRITQFVRGERWRTRRLTSVTGKLPVA